MNQAVTRNVRLTLAIAASLCLLSASAVADERPWENERWYTTYGGIDSTIDAFSTNQQWLQLETPTDDRHAVEYKNGLSFSLEDRFVFSIQSPFAGEWAPGFAFELRF